MARQGVGQVVARQVGVRDVGQVRVDGKGGGQAGSGARWWPGEMVARRDGGEMVARWWSGEVGQVGVGGQGGGQAGSGARWWPGEMMARRDGGEMVARWLRDGGEMVARWWPGEIIFCQG